LEAFFNLLWLGLSFALLGFWFWSQRRWADASLRTSTRMQVMALAILIVILLPVVSLTDDLQACTAPAEAEHLTRRGDLQAHADSPLHTASIVVATLLSVHQASGFKTLAHLSPAIEIVTSSEGYLSIVGNRPPPLA
jgi:uncharacterized membrane protein